MEWIRHTAAEKIRTGMMMKEKTDNKSRFPLSLLGMLIHEFDKEVILTSYEVQYKDILNNKGKIYANVWLWFQIMKAFPGIFSAWLYKKKLLISNYFKVSSRNILKQKLLSFINITGLAIGLGFSSLLLLWIVDEISYDKHHEKADNIYRVVSYIGEKHMAFTPIPMAESLSNDYPEVLSSVGLYLIKYSRITYENRSFVERDVHWVDNSFFDIFSTPFISGDAKSALLEPYSAVMTERTAERYFGDTDPIDKLITIRDGEKQYRITGIIKDPPAVSHFHYNVIASFNSLEYHKSTDWQDNFIYTYILLPENYDHRLFESKLPDVVRKYVSPRVAQATGSGMNPGSGIDEFYQYKLQPLKDIHLRSNLLYEVESNGNFTYVYIFSIISVLILIIAVINYLNLSVSYSINRTKEVGLRKVLGSNKHQIITQFLFESVMICFISVIIALVFLEISLPYFNEFAGKNLSINYLDNPYTLPSIAGFILFIGLISGSYPALFISNFKPVSILKNSLSTGKEKNLFRNASVVIQLVISFIVINGTIIVGQQLDFIRNKDLGFVKENLLYISKRDYLVDQKEAYIQELLKNPDITSVSYANHLPGDDLHAEFYYPEGENISNGKAINIIYTDHHFIETLGLEIISGRNYSPEILSDSNAVVINRKAAEILGLEDPIGKKLISASLELDQPRTIIGVFEDFNFASLHNEIKPFMIEMLGKNWGQRYLARVSPDNIPETIKYIESRSEEFFPGEPLGYIYLDENINRMYEPERKTLKIFNIFSLLTIFIACLGLFGSVYYNCRQRRKEVGIRKAIGASEKRIVSLFGYDLFFLVIFSAVVSSPLSYFIMKNWLMNFAYQLELSVTPFIMSLFVILSVVLLTAFSQIIRTARINPVESLKHE
ncbi:ABC transporter permease [candidate division KSB1 bacterium]